MTRARALFAATIAVVAACAIPTENGEVGALPDRESFTQGGVSLFMERRCGALDCHGQPGRPLRLYGKWGLRLQAKDDATRDDGETTNEERLENYRAVIGLEPEGLSRCFSSRGEDRKNLQLLLKPLDIDNDGIRHKGGPVLRPTPSDPGWQCLFGWASGTANADACAKAARLE